MTTRALVIRDAILADLRAAAPGGVLAANIHADLRQAIAVGKRPAIVVDMGDEDAPVREYSKRLRNIGITVRILADGADPFAVIDPIREAVHASVMGGMSKDGLISGGAVTPAASGQVDKVDTAALTCMLASTVEHVLATVNKAITRPATNVAKVNSITVNSSAAIAVVAGTDGTTTAFSETRGAAGGPPILPAGSIEIAQVRVTSAASAVITSGQIIAADVTLRGLADGIEEGASARQRVDLDVQIGSLVTVYQAKYTTTGEALT